jgi:hypothetical protein
MLLKSIWEAFEELFTSNLLGVTFSFIQANDIWFDFFEKLFEMLFLNSGIESVDIPGYNRNLFTGELL